MGDQRDKINALLAVAQHPTTPQAEAETALALASKLMLKNGYSSSDLAETRAVYDTSVLVERIPVRGIYRVRRQNLLYTIALIHSCAAYRDFDQDDACIIVVYGRPSDIFATKTIFTAAEAMAARLLPRGDRSSRTSWWKGFQMGLHEVLQGARSEFITETQGAGLVLADRMTRATNELRATSGPLRGGTSYADTSSHSYKDGRSAGRSFGVSGRSFGSGVRGELQ